MPRSSQDSWWPSWTVSNDSWYLSSDRFLSMKGRHSNLAEFCLQLFSSCNLLQVMACLFSQPAANLLMVYLLLRPEIKDRSASSETNSLVSEIEKRVHTLLLLWPVAQKIYNCKGPSISSHHYLFKYDIDSHSKTKDIISNSHHAIVARFSSSIPQVR